MTIPLKLGFIGSGKMAEAIIRGILSKKLLEPSSIYCVDTNTKRLKIMEDLKVNTHKRPTDLKEPGVVILAIKPDIVLEVLKQTSETLQGKLLVSICAGISLSALEKSACTTARFIRVMPNTPCLVGESASCYSPGENTTGDDCEVVEKIFGAVGIILKVPESKMDGVTGLSGSGPAYVYMFIEALADAGVREGLPRELALKLAAQTVYGASKMVLCGDTHPAALRNDVESPGGTTIEATTTLEKCGFRSAVISAVRAATQRVKSLTK